MKTSAIPQLLKSHVLRRAAVALFVAGLVAGPASALNPPTTTRPDTSVTPPGATTAIAVDPHLSYLESLDTRSPLVRERSTALRLMLGLRETVARQFLQASAEEREAVARKMERSDQQIEVAERALEEALAATTPGDGPYYVPPPVIDVEGLRKIARHNRELIELDVPRPAPLPALSAPPREAMFLDFLAARAGDSAFAQNLVADVARMLQQRRELTYRDLTARADERVAIESAISAVSHHIRESSRLAAQAATVSHW